MTPNILEDEMVAHRIQNEFIDRPQLTVGLFAGSNGPALLLKSWHSFLRQIEGEIVLQLGFTIWTTDLSS